MTQALRWIAVIPSAVLAAVLVSFPVHWVVLMTFGNDDSMIQLSRDGLANVELLAQAFFGPFAAVWASGRIAPQRKFEAALVVGVLIGLVPAIAPTISGGSLFVTVPGVLLNLLGIATGAYLARREVEHAASIPEYAP